MQAIPTEQLVTKLRSHGPLHNTSDVRDRERLIRAIEIAEAAPSARAPSIALDSRVFGLRWDRSDLRKRITQRLADRLEHGLLEEVSALLDRGLTHDQLIFYGLEYRYVTEHLRGDLTRGQMFDALNAAIHRFAKRQDTWFRRMERQGVDIHWLIGLRTNLIGPPDEIRRRLREYRDCGVNTLRVGPMGDTLDQRLAGLGQLQDLVSEVNATATVPGDERSID